MTLNILTPTVSLMGLEVSSVFLPGSAGLFEVLNNHAPLLSSLDGGVIRWVNDKTADPDAQESFAIKSGFVEIRQNVITVVAQI